MWSPGRSPSMSSKTRERLRNETDRQATLSHSALPSAFTTQRFAFACSPKEKPEP